MEYRRLPTQVLKLISALLILSCLAGHANNFSSVPGCTVNRDHKNLLYASCKGQNLTSIPTSFPADITGLDLNYNLLGALSDHSFARYAHLHALDLGHSGIVNISSCAFEGLFELQVLNLASNNLSSLEGNHSGQGSGIDPWNGCSPLAKSAQQSAPKGRRQVARSRGRVFRHLSRLRSLDLSRNHLRTVSSETFAGLENLQKLNLAANALTDVCNGTFLGLPNLTVLDISKNKLTAFSPGALVGLSSLKELRLLGNNDFDYSNDTFPPDLFEPVASTLTTLSLTASRANGKPSLPDAALSTLVSLEHLVVNKLQEPQFGQSFTAMKSLRTLDFSYWCDVRRVDNDSFSSLTTLTRLNLNHCSKLFVLEPCAFCLLERLEVLSLESSSYVGLGNAFRSVSAFVGRNISVLNFHNVAGGTKRGQPGTVLNEKITKYLLQTCVSTLILSQNDITTVTLHSLTKPGSLFGKCIQHLDLSSNYIFSVSPMETFLMFSTLKNLRSLRAERQHTCSLQNALRIDRVRYTLKMKPLIMPLYNFHMPPFFNFLNYSGTCGKTGFMPPKVKVLPPNALKVLDLSYTYGSYCGTEFQGLGTTESLNISHTYCRELKPVFFDSFPMLRELSLQRINFDHRLLSKGAGRLFQNLPLLQRFDFSFNDLDLPLIDLLHAQHDLRELLLVGNRYQRLPVDLDQHANLSVLDLSRNAISQLSLEDRRELDRFAASRSGLFSLRLHGNPIACTCQTLPFIQWLGQTSVHLDIDFNHTCVTEDGTTRSTGEVLGNLDFEWRGCVGAGVFWVAVAGLLLLLLLSGAAWAVATNATRIRFFFTRYRHIRFPQREDFRKDAYVSYCDDDTDFVTVHLRRVLQVQRGVDLLIKDLPKDEAGTQLWTYPGESVAEKMLEHIDICWKVLLVLTPALTRDPLAGFMSLAALHSISDKMADRVVLLCVGARHMPALAYLRALLRVVPEKQIFFVPQGAGDDHPAWNAVANVILN